MANGTLSLNRDVIKRKKVFMMDRNDGKCYSAFTKKEVSNLIIDFSDRFVEQLRIKGQWAWVILDRIPGNSKTDYEWEEYENYE
jgi:hypothetical protein